jgi:hypothetical protein
MALYIFGGFGHISNTLKHDIVEMFKNTNDTNLNISKLKEYIKLINNDTCILYFLLVNDKCNIMFAQYKDIIKKYTKHSFSKCTDTRDILFEVLKSDLEILF